MIDLTDRVYIVIFNDLVNFFKWQKPGTTKKERKDHHQRRMTNN